MFFSGGTFGHESEVREATKRQTGRRHQPRDMAEGQDAHAGGAISGGAGRGGGGGGGGGGGAERHVSEQKQMSSGPSFMDRMYAHDASSTEPPHAARRHKSGPKDNLNIFSWQDTDPTQKPPQKGSRGPRAARDVDPTAAVPTVEDRRAQESRKFETHSESTFLKFSDTPAEGQPAGAVQGGRRVSNTTRREEGMMGELMREQQARPHGKRVQGEQTAKRKGGAAVEDPGVAGFPGMGKRSAPPVGQRLNRKNVESNVFPPSTPPWAQHDDIQADRGRGGGPGPRAGAPPAPATGPVQPSYRLDERDYEDRDDVDTRQDHQRRMQEIDMCNDGEDGEDYAVPPQRGAGALAHLRWLDDPKDGGSAQQHKYDFDPDQGEFYEEDPNQQRRNEYH